jgi:hypothetical protein
MTSFLSSIKADLLDRRLLPALIVVGLALLGAGAYTVLGGGSTAAAPPASAPVARVSGISVSPAPANPDQPVAETTTGAAKQRGGATRDPFVPLPSSKPTVSTSAVSKTTSSASLTAPAKSVSGTAGTGAVPAPVAPSKPSAPVKPQTVYHVAALFGVLPAGTLPLNAQLTSYANLTRLTPLPSAKLPLVALLGVTTGGKAAVFLIVGEAIIHGTATCLPSAALCEGLELKPGQTEQLEYLPPSGPAVTYELRIVSIVAGTASAASLKHPPASESKAGRELLRKSHLQGLPGLRYSPSAGVLVFAPHRASVARAHAAA